MENPITITEISSGAIKEYGEQIEAIRHQIMKLVCDGYKLPTPDVACEQGANDTIIANISMFWPQEVIEISIDIPKAKIKPRWRRMKPGVWVKWSGYYARNVETLDVFPVLMRLSHFWWCDRYRFASSWQVDSHIYGTGAIYGNVANARRIADNRQICYIPGFEIYKEGEYGLEG